MIKISADTFFKTSVCPPAPRGINPTLLAALLLIFFSGSACGKLGPLTLPERPAPLPVSDITLDQRENMIIVSWSFPPVLKDQATLVQVEKISHLEIWHTAKPLEKKPFDKVAKRLKKMSGKDLAKAPSGRYEISFPFSPDDLDSLTHRFAIRYRHNGEKAEFSPIFSHQSVLPARPITDLSLQEEGRHLLLSWTSPQFNIQGKPLRELIGYHLYVQKKTDAGWEPDIRLNKTPILREGYEILSSEIEGEFRYRVTALASERIESDFSNAVTARVVDDKPPNRPTNLICLSSDDHIILTWRGTNDQDFDQYRILRRKNPTEPFTLLAEGVKTNFYRDYKVKKGQAYTYVITAVDKKGNESNESPPAEGTFQ
jgi:predicted small lipoprotein YifL